MGKYVEEALGKKIGLGHRLTKLKEIEETPRASCSNGYHTGAKNVREAERLKWKGLWMANETRPEKWHREEVSML